MERYTFGIGISEADSQNWPPFLIVALDQFSDYFGEHYRGEMFLNLDKTSFVFLDPDSFNERFKIAAQNQQIKNISNILSQFPVFPSNLKNHAGLDRLGEFTNSINVLSESAMEDSLTEILSRICPLIVDNQEARAEFVNTLKQYQDEIVTSWLIFDYSNRYVFQLEDFALKENDLFANFLSYSLMGVPEDYNNESIKKHLLEIKVGLSSYNATTDTFENNSYLDLYKAFTGKNCSIEEAEADQRTRAVLVKLANRYMMLQGKLVQARKAFASEFDKKMSSSKFYQDTSALADRVGFIYDKKNILESTTDFFKKRPFSSVDVNITEKGELYPVCHIWSGNVFSDKVHELLHDVSLKSSVKKEIIDGKQVKTYKIKSGLSENTITIGEDSIRFSSMGEAINEIFTQYVALSLSSRPEFSDEYLKLYGEENMNSHSIYNAFLPIVGDFFDKYEDVLKTAYISDFEPLYKTFGESNYNILLSRLDMLMEFNSMNSNMLDGVVEAFRTTDQSPENIERRIKFIAKNYIGSEDVMQTYISLINEIKQAIERCDKHAEALQENPKNED